MLMTNAKPYSLSDLPLPAKFVVTAFLLSIGLGFVSGMVQLHMKESKHDGAPLPGPDDVERKYCSYVPFDGQFPKSKMESLISGNPVGAFSKQNMAPAFYAKSADYKQAIKKQPASIIDAERDGERAALVAWLALDLPSRKKAYDDDTMPLPAELAAKPITAEFVEDGKAKIKSLIEERCARCHDGQQQSPAMNEWVKIEPLTIAPAPTTVDFHGVAYVKNDKQVSIDGLAQSTHAHLFGFSMLYALSGFVLAFTKYPKLVKLVFCPLALVAQTTDICCWWLSRMDPPLGLLFPKIILAAGGLAALSLAVQIFLSLFDLYGRTGKVLVLLLLLTGLGGGGYTVYTKAIKPALDAEREQSAALVSPA